MTDKEKIIRMEQEISKLKDQMAFLAKQICPVPDYDSAIEALLNGDPQPLDVYLKCGGKLPETDGRHAELLR